MKSLNILIGFTLIFIAGLSLVFPWLVFGYLHLYIRIPPEMLCVIWSCGVIFVVIFAFLGKLTIENGKLVEGK